MLLQVHATDGAGGDFKQFLLRFVRLSFSNLYNSTFQLVFVSIHDFLSIKDLNMQSDKVRQIFYHSRKQIM